MSVFQTDDGKITNFDLGKNTESLKRSAVVHTEEDALKEAIFYAQSLFARRLASARHLVILSCGNCVSAKSMEVSKIASQLEKQNIIVSSWGLYQMRFVNSDDESIGKIVGYDESKLYYIAESDVDSDSRSSFKFDHNIDACQRLADKTHGTVFNIRNLRNAKVMETIVKSFKKTEKHHTFNVKSCHLVNNQIGTYADFKFAKFHATKDEEEDDE